MRVRTQPKPETLAVFERARQELRARAGCDHMRRRMRVSLLPGPWWRRWQVGVRIGVVEVSLAAHVLAIAILMLLAWSLALQAPDAGALGLTPTNAPAIALLYTLVQAGRVVHEAGHALVGIVAGRQLRAVRLTSLLMAADFPGGELEQARPAHERCGHDPKPP